MEASGERTGHDGLPLLAVHSRRPSKKDEPWAPCAGPGCTKTISPEAAARVRFCGNCQLREREIRFELSDIDLTPEEISFLWERRSYYRISEAAKFLSLKTRTLYALVAKERVKAVTNPDGCLVVGRRELIERARQLRGVIGLKEAAEEMEIDYGYLRELVRRNVVNAEKTFWGHYGLRRARLSSIRDELARALPAEGDYNLVSFSEELGVHHSLVQKWIKQGKLQYSKGLTGRITIPRSELSRFVRLIEERPRFLPQRVRDRILEHRQIHNAKLEAG